MSVVEIYSVTPVLPHAFLMLRQCFLALRSLFRMSVRHKHVALCQCFRIHASRYASVSLCCDENCRVTPMFSYTCIALRQCLCSFMWRYATDSSSVRSITPTRPYKLYAAAFWQRNKWDEPIWTCLKQGIRRALHADMMVAQALLSTLFKQVQPASPASPKPAANHTAHRRVFLLGAS